MSRMYRHDSISPATGVLCVNIKQQEHLEKIEKEKMRKKGNEEEN